tara:strand:+ start:606 stop:953 length:348 start_codon:yes stop_codon:yes gene_type:complete
MSDFIDFGAAAKPQELNETDRHVRPNLRVTPCCYNCYFFRIVSGPTGICILPLRVKPYKRFSWTDKVNADKMATVHLSCTCDNHVWNRSNYTKLAPHIKARMKKSGLTTLPEENE